MFSRQVLKARKKKLSIQREFEDEAGKELDGKLEGNEAPGEVRTEHGEAIETRLIGRS